MTSYVHFWECGELTKLGSLCSWSTGYPSNLSDTEGKCVQRHLPPVP
jgi:hypothetical protein